MTVINKLLELLERFVVAHESIAETLSYRGSSNRPIYIAVDEHWVKK